ncbi:hypothetical protein CTA2_8415 [Colletotrichum tanaceti]|uniref:Uncharacterized protein n=1 Tax=Colletotrichum tanaceti TaxID=1306861 RepID=A0A4U6X7E5_9PEZI|nr:hypothetical protein CTA2_8415 [Colletotrichum tanaceti]TKW51410.1 hypothetical protein CTA1_4387 [Colletotrichum tanaceti]
MGDGQDGGAARGALEALLEGGLAGGVEGAGALVEQQQAGLAHEGAGDGQALPLAAGETGGRGPALGVVALGQGGDDVVDVGQPAGLLDLGLGGLGVGGGAEADVEADAAVEQGRVLRHDGDGVPEGGRQVGDVVAVDEHLALRGGVEALDEVHDGGLAGARGAHQAAELAGLQGEGDVVEDVDVWAARVGEGDVVEGDPDAAAAAAGAGVGPLGLGVGGGLDVDVHVDVDVLPGELRVHKWLGAGVTEVVVPAEVDDGHDARQGGTGAGELGGEGEHGAPELGADEHGDEDDEELGLGVLAAHDELGPPPVGEGVDKGAGGVGDGQPDVGRGRGAHHLLLGRGQQAGVVVEDLALEREGGDGLDGLDGLGGHRSGVGKGGRVALLVAGQHAQLHEAGAQEQGDGDEADDGDLPGDDVGQHDGHEHVDADGEDGADGRPAEAADGRRVLGDDGQQARRAAAVRLVPLHVLAEQGAEGQHADRVEQLLGHDAEAGPGEEVGKELDRRQPEQQPREEAAHGQDPLHRAGAGVEGGDVVAEDDAGPREGAADDGGGDDGDDDPDQRRSDEAPEALEHGAVGLGRVEAGHLRLVLVMVVAAAAAPLFTTRLGLLQALGVVVVMMVLVRLLLLLAHHDVVVLERRAILHRVARGGAGAGAGAGVGPGAVAVGGGAADALQPGHAGKGAVLAGHQVIVGTLLDDPAGVHDDDVVGVADGRQPVGDGDDGAVLGRRLLDGALDALLAGRVERRGGLVQHEDLGVADQGPGEGDALALAAADERPAGAGRGAVAVVQPVDEGGGVGLLGRVPDEVDNLPDLGPVVVHRRQRVLAPGGELGQLAAAEVGLQALVLGLGRVDEAEGDVLEDGPVQQRGLLLDEADEAAEAADVEGAQVVAVEEDLPLVRVLETGEQGGDGGLAAAREADDGRVLAGGELEVDVAQDGLAGPRRVLKGDVAELEALGVVQGQDLALVRGAVDLRGRLYVFPQTLVGGRGASEKGEDRGDGAEHDAGWGGGQTWKG